MSHLSIEDASCRCTRRFSFIRFFFPSYLLVCMDLCFSYYRCAWQVEDMVRKVDGRTKRFSTNGKNLRKVGRTALLSLGKFLYSSFRRVFRKTCFVVFGLPAIYLYGVFFNAFSFYLFCSPVLRKKVTNFNFNGGVEVLQWLLFRSSNPIQVMFSRQDESVRVTK